MERTITRAIIISLMMCLPIFAMGSTAISLQVFFYGNTSGGPSSIHPNSPPSMINVTIDDHTLHFDWGHPDYTVQLLDGDNVVFEIYFPYTALNILLPASLTGTYELRVVDDGYYYSGLVSL